MRGRLGALVLLALSAMLGAHQAHARGTPRATARAKTATTPNDWASTPAWRYGSLDKAACEAELRSRHVAFTPVASARGVIAPVRLAGPLHGVAFRTELPTRMRASSPYEIGDCRLVLALDDFATILEKHDVIEVHHFSMYRPPSPRWPAHRPAARHSGALAIDAARFIKSDGTILDVEKDFHGRIGAESCGAGATPPSPSTPQAIELRQIVCEAAGARLFNVTLTPDFNYEHRNHFHLEVAAGQRWFLVD